MRKNANRRVLKESNWKKYIGSSKETLGLVVASKSIIHLCSNKRTSTYLEQKELFCRGAIESNEYRNANIGGKFYDNCLDGLLEYEKRK